MELRLAYQLTKKQLIEKLNEAPIVHNTLSGVSIVVNPNKGKDSKTLNNLSEAILGITRILEGRNNRPVYGVMIGENGIKKGK